MSLFELSSRAQLPITATSLIAHVNGISFVAPIDSKVPQAAFELADQQWAKEKEQRVEVLTPLQRGLNITNLMELTCLSVYEFVPVCPRHSQLPSSLQLTAALSPVSQT